MIAEKMAALREPRQTEKSIEQVDLTTPPEGGGLF